VKRKHHQLNKHTEQPPEACTSGVTRGGMGAQFPRRRITAAGTEKSKQCHKYFLQYSTFVSERPQVRT